MQDDEVDAKDDSSNSTAIDGLVSKGLLDKSSPLYKAAVRIQARYRGYVVRKARLLTPLAFLLWLQAFHENCPGQCSVLCSSKACLIMALYWL